MVRLTRVIASNRATLLIAATLAACSSPPLADRTAADGEKVVVRLIDADFVRVGERRIPWEELVYDMRVRCRARRGEGRDAPWVQFVVPVDTVVPAVTVDSIQKGLREAGVRRIDMTMADS